MWCNLMQGKTGVLLCPVFTLLTLLAYIDAAYYDSFTGQQISEAKFRQLQAQNLVPYCGIEVKECNETEWRRMDNSCNNLHYPPRGATLTPYRRMLPPEFGPGFDHRRSKSGAPLPLVRAVRTSIMSDGRVASEDYTHMVPNGALVITGDVTSVHDTVNYVGITTTCCAPGGDEDPRCRPVYVPEDDVHLRRSNIRCLNLTRVITYQSLGCAPQNTPPERINTSPPMLDLSAIYGDDERSTRKGREFRGGRMRTETVNGQEWPPGGAAVCFQNQWLRGETRCHDTPLAAVNIIVGTNVMAMWIFRLHNSIARELEKMNPCWDDDRLFFQTREIVIAYFNHIWYYELMPQLMGLEYLQKNKVVYDTWGHVDDYNPTLEPRVSIEYVIATRWFHSMQEGRLKTYDNKGKLLDELKAVELTLRTGILPNNRTLEGITQGFFRQPSAASDHLIDPDMGERVLGSLQTASDVMSSDIMKSREAGLPPYNKYRAICNLPVAKDWDDLLYWMPEEQVDGLRRNYEHVDDVDLTAGIIAERPMKGAALGPTLACIMADQLRYWRQADRFFYENSIHPGSFTVEQLYQIKQITMARIICDHGDEVDSIQPWAFLVSRPGNEIVPCEEIRKPSLEPWRDEKCVLDHVPGKQKLVLSRG